MVLEMMYLCAELVQIIVGQSDSELEVQRYGMKKNTLTVDLIMLKINCEQDNVKNCPQTASVSFLKIELRKLIFQFLNFEASSVWFLENRSPTFSWGATRP